MAGNRVEVAVPVIAYSFSFNLDQSRENFNNVVVQFHVPIDEDTNTLNGYLDKVVSTVERQKQKYVLETLKKEIELNERSVRQMKADMERIKADAMAAYKASGRQGAYKPSATHEQQRQMAENNVVQMNQTIERQKLMVTQIEDKLSGVKQLPAN